VTLRGQRQPGWQCSSGSADRLVTLFATP